MNRETRRNLKISKETSERLDHLGKPCTILEAVQLSQGVSEDSIKNYHNSINPIIVSLSIQLEVLKEILFSNEILSKEDFVSIFNDKLEDYNNQKEEIMSQIDSEVKSQRNSSELPKTDVVSGDLEINVSK